MNNEKINNSTFFIVLNTNKTIEQLGREKALLIEKGINYLSKSIQEKKNYFIGHNQIPLSDQDIKKINSIKIDYNIEIGEKKHRFHVNLIIETKHQTFLRINKNAMLNFFEKLVGDKCSIKIKAVGDSIQKLREYALKNKTSVLKQLKSIGESKK